MRILLDAAVGQVPGVQAELGRGQDPVERVDDDGFGTRGALVDRQHGVGRHVRPSWPAGGLRVDGAHVGGWVDLRRGYTSLDQPGGDLPEPLVGVLGIAA